MPAKVLKNGTVISFDDDSNSLKVLPRASVLIVDDRIAAIELNFEDLTIPKDAEVVDVIGKIVSPGFINTHFHSWQSVCRTIGPNTNLIEYFGWVCGITPQVPDTFTPDDIYISSLQGYLEGLNSGVTTFVDHAHHNWSPDVVRPGYDAATDSGARVFWCYDVNGRNPASPPEKQWSILEQIAEDHRQTKSPVTLGLGFDGNGGVPEGQDAVAFTKAKMDKLGMGALTIHHLGGPWPGPHGPSALASQGLPSLSQPLIISHAGHLTAADRTAVRTHDMNISITPESEFHYGHGQLTGHLITSHASLGVDTNWTFAGDILTQARLWLQATRNRLYESVLTKGLMPGNNPVDVEEAFLLATRQGGKGLRRERELGVLRVGAKADVVVFNGEAHNLLGWSDPIAAVILHANTGDVEHVIVEGEWRKRDFRLVGVKGGEAEVKRRFVEAARRLHPLVREPPPIGDQLWGKSNIGAVERVGTRE